MTRLFYLALVLIGLHASFAYAEIDVYTFDTPQQEKQFQELSNTLRCPKCQNNTIADSNAALAQDLRGVGRRRRETSEGRSVSRKRRRRSSAMRAVFHDELRRRIKATN